jgi:UDP-GlcNAc:undecaprenyl-phosphate GlcNAc-1-phosphate transferase
MAWVLTPYVIRLAYAINMLDVPRRGKIHRRTVPLLGGLAVFGGMIAGAAAAIGLSTIVGVRISSIFSPVTEVVAAAAVFGAGLVCLGVGFIDDKRGLSARKKLLGQLPVAITFALFVHFDRFVVPGVVDIELGSLAVPITVFWLVGLTNAFNLIDGVDGLSSGFALIAAFTLGLIAVTNGQPLLAVIAFGLSGACLGFLRHNQQPARIFLGDTGSLFVGMSLAALCVVITTRFAPIGDRPVPAMLASGFILGYPIVDTVLAMVRRSLHGKAMMSADNGHIHHLVLARGYNHRQASLAIYLFTVPMCVIGIALLERNSVLVLAMFSLVAGALPLGLYLIGFFRPFMPSYVRMRRPRFMFAFHCAGLIRARLHLAQSTHEVVQLLEEGGRDLGLGAGALFFTGGSFASDDGEDGVPIVPTRAHAALSHRSDGPGEDSDCDQPRLLHCWGCGSGQELVERVDAGDGNAFSRTTPDFELIGLFESTGLPADLVIEHHTRLEQILQTATQRVLALQRRESDSEAWSIPQTVSRDPHPDSTSRRLRAVAAASAAPECDSEPAPSLTGPTASGSGRRTLTGG